MNDTIEVNGLYKSLSPQVRKELSHHEEQATIPAGTRLIRPGVTLEHVIVILSGTVKISVPAGDKALSLNVAGCGRVLGLRPILDNTPPEIEATTAEECTILRIPRKGFLEVLKQHPEVYFAISRVLSEDLHAAERFLRDVPRAIR